MPITLSHRLFIEHSQYYTGCSWPTFSGIGDTPHEALEDVIEMTLQEVESMIARTRPTIKEIRAIQQACKNYPNTEPDEPGELADIPGWDDDMSEASWHCELTIDGLEEPS